MTDENIVPIDEADEAVIIGDEEQSEAVESGEAEPREVAESGEAESDADSEGDEIAECAEDGDSVEDDGDAEEEEKESESVSFAEKLFNFTELLVFTLAAVVLLLSFVFRHAEVIGSSMDTTLANGEHLIISDLFYTPERGDIIVFEDHSTIYKKPLIKRVIAVGGDHIRIKNGVVHLNGALLDESAYIRGAYTMGNVDMIVPDGEVFVMGDNRGASDDSRNNLIGTIDEDAILGKVILRFFPFDSFGSVN
jgi:signal peptidase I